MKSQLLHPCSTPPTQAKPASQGRVTAQLVTLSPRDLHLLQDVLGISYLSFCFPLGAAWPSPWNQLLILQSLPTPQTKSAWADATLESAVANTDATHTHSPPRTVITPLEHMGQDALLTFSLSVGFAFACQPKTWQNACLPSLRLQKALVLPSR